MHHKAKVFLVLFLSSTFYALGLYFPILSTKKQIFNIVLSYQDVRLFDSVKMFYKDNDFLLAAIIFIFTIILPIVKYLDLYNRIFHFINFSKKATNLLHKIDKWSMIDVFLVALLLLNFKMDSNLIVMRLKIGTTFIALSVILRMISSEIIDSTGKPNTLLD